MPSKIRSAASGGSLIVACLLASCMRFGYDPADELDGGLGLDGVGGSRGDGGSMGSFAGADGAGDPSTDSSSTSSNTTAGSTGAASTDAAGGTTDGGGATSTDAGGSAGTSDTGGATSTGAGGATSTASGGATSTDAGGASGTGAGGATSTDTGGAAGSGGVSGAGGATSTEGTTSIGGATSTSTATTSATTGGGEACAATGTIVSLASFDADLEGFVVTGAGSPSLDWSGSVGNPELGAMHLNASSGGSMQVRNLTPPGDLSGRVMSVNVYVESGNGVQIILFAQSGSTQKWADGGRISATNGQWYCLTLDFDDPPTKSAGFDSTDVRIVGVDVQGSGGVVAYIDQFAY